MVETKGYTLEEIAQAFDGSTANLNVYPELEAHGSPEYAETHKSGDDTIAARD